MTPQQKLKWAILAKVAELEKISVPSYPCENIDELYDDAIEYDWFWDARSAVRRGQVETGLPCELSRDYESKAVAMQLPDQSWIGWTYWYGGGKHSEPEHIDWIEYAYDVSCREETKVVRTFSSDDA